MNAVVYSTYGSPDVLQFKQVGKPVPKENEVLIRVLASSVNSWDWDLLRGKPFLARLGGLFKPQYNILGADIAGRVEGVGSNVKQLKPGDEVFGDISGHGWGGFAEYVCVSEQAVTHKSSAMTFEEAAAVPQAAVLALQALRDKGQIQRGHKVLINGAGGGVGTFAIQIAKAYGAEVTGVDSTDKLELMSSIGADHVIDYTKEDFTKKEQQYNLIVDVVAYRSLLDYKKALCPGGTFVMVGGKTNRILQLLLLGQWMGKRSSRKMGLLMHRPNNEDLKVMNEYIESGKVVPVIDRLYPLIETAEACRYLGSGQVKGKVVITMNG